MLQNLLFSSFLFISLIANAQLDTLRIMQYNLLMYPESNLTKGQHLKKIITYLQPDVLCLNELSSIDAYDSLNSSVLDTSVYATGNWYGDSFISNGIIYNHQRLQVDSAFAFQTLPRKTHVYRFFYKQQNFTLYPDTVFFSVAASHFKSSQGASNVDERLIQADDIRDYTEVFEPSNFMLTGDFNMYTSTESGYIRLTEPGIGRLIDPINRPGNWNNNSSFADIHTQSPRTTSFDGGVTGGMDDRFDFILANDEVMNGTGGLMYIPGSYRAVGNDGQHFNLSILSNPANTSAPDSIIQALHAMSDHLPVVMDVLFDPSSVSTGLKSQDPNQGVCAEFPFQSNPMNRATLLDLMGKQIFAGSLAECMAASIPSGNYLLTSYDVKNRQCQTLMIVTSDGRRLFSR